MTKIKVVIATRKNQIEFFNNTKLGQYLKYFHRPNIEFCIFINNTVGLPILYNKIINDSRNDPCIILFMHDDVCMLDFYWPERIIEGLKKYHLIGLAGNKKRVFNQPGWSFIDSNFTWDNLENLSGIIGHGNNFPPSVLDFFGPSDQQVLLLDGLFLAVKSHTLFEYNIYFDTQFDFHFYDMDICRQIEEKKLTCGTWPISVIHESTGSYGSPSWIKAYQKYINKWKS